MKYSSCLRIPKLWSKQQFGVKTFGPKPSVINHVKPTLKINYPWLHHFLLTHSSLYLYLHKISVGQFILNIFPFDRKNIFICGACCRQSCRWELLGMKNTMIVRQYPNLWNLVCLLSFLVYWLIVDQEVSSVVDNW